MSTSTPLPEGVALNPRVLKWARRESGWAPEDLADKLKVKRERFASWESGERAPTLRQVENVARQLHRPLNLFFLPEPPSLPPLAAEYRRLTGVRVGAESPQLRLALRQMLNRRDRALDLIAELGADQPSLPPAAHIAEGVEVTAERLRNYLGVSPERQLSWTSEWQAWRFWRSAAEAKGILVFQFYKVALAEVRGLSILEMPLPVVGINAKETVPEVKSFTLLHEIVHLMLAAGQEERPALKEDRTDEQWEDVERFAEQVASHALVPEHDLSIQVSQLDSPDWSLNRVRRLARRYWITPLAMATRLRDSGMMSRKQYNEWRSQWNEYVAALPARGAGFATPAEKALSRNGGFFVRLVLEAMAANRISLVDAARYLDLKFQHFDSLKDTLNGPGSLATRND